MASIRHKGLQELYQNGHSKLLQPQHLVLLRFQLFSLDTAVEISDMDLSGYRLHKLRGVSEQRWSTSVDKNWRLTFEFESGNLYLLDYEDYH